MILRPYQQLAVDRINASAGHAPLLVLPTGGGKTAIMAELTRLHTGRVVIVVHRAELVEQTVDALNRAGVADVGVVTAAKSDATQRVTVAMLQTMGRRKSYPPADLLLIDEAHHGVASQWSDLIEHYHGVRRIGFTATPVREDGKPLGDAFDDLIVAATSAELLSLGHLVPCETIRPLAKMKNLARGIDEIYEKHARNKQTIIFCVSVKQAQALEIPNSATVTGTTSPAVRRAAVDAFRKGELQTLINCSVYTEGFDAPNAEVCVLARPCKSLGLYLQIVGRVLRPSPGKTKATLFDLYGTSNSHGLPHSLLEFDLSGEGIKRASVAPLAQCPSCGRVYEHMPNPCECGFERKPPRDPQVIRAALYRMPAMARTGDPQRDYFNWLTVDAVSRGHKPASIGVRFKIRFGGWPPWNVEHEYHHLAGQLEANIVA